MQMANKAAARERKKESLIFGLNDASAKIRQNWRIILFVVIWTSLSISASIFTPIGTQETERLFIVMPVSCFKYIILLGIAYYLARKQTAHYLDDIFELNNEKMAAAFIEEVAFGGGEQQITIDKGKISEEDEKSPIVLIGGPGKLQVNLDSVAVLEKLDGEPEIISPSSEPWELGCFERIREIGKSDEVGKRKYAIINLRDQFLKELKVVARTKDGIRIYVERIKVKFSILRDPHPQKPADLEKNPFTFDRKAVHNLVFGQSVITQPYDKSTASVGFPWNTAAIPLVILELEKLIQSHLLSETFSGMSQKEFDELVEKEKEKERAKYHTLGDKPFEEKQEPITKAPSLIPRTEMRDFFYSPAFKQKAADLGVAIHWIDIGTWQFDEKIVFEKVKEARELSAENRKRKVEIERRHKQRIIEELIELIKKVIVSNYTKKVTSRDFTQAEWLELKERIRKNPEFANPYIEHQLIQQIAMKIATKTTAINMLKAFRMEFLGAREFIKTGNKSPSEKEAELKKINNALSNIEKFIYHYTKTP